MNTHESDRFKKSNPIFLVRSDWSSTTQTVLASTKDPIVSLVSQMCN